MSYAGFWVTRGQSGGLVSRHLDDLNAVLEFDVWTTLGNWFSPSKQAQRRASRL
jgi:hypothetical protein